MRYRSVYSAIFLCVLVVGVLLVALGVRDYRISREPWAGEFRFERNEDAVTSATVRFSGRPRVGLWSIFPRRASGSDAIVVGLHGFGTEPSRAFADLLTVDLYGEEEIVALESGGTVSIDGDVATVLDLRPFVGLLPDAQGVPMANVSLKVGDASWLENVMLMEAQWRRVEDGPALRLRWCANEEEAKRLADAGRPGLEAARWGVHDRGRTHWFDSFHAGAGVELDDGTSVTLVGLEPSVDDARVLAVDVLKDDVRRRERILPNAAGPLIVFEDPGGLAELLLVFAWKDDAARVTYFGEEGDVRVGTIGGGETWAPEGVGIALRLEQAIRAAVPVVAGQTALYEAVLELASRRIRIRQGEAVRVGDALLRYTHVPVADSASYRIDISNGVGEDWRIELAPGGRHNFASPFGEYSLGYEDITLENGVVIRPEGRVVPPRLVAGLVLALIALAGVAYVRRSAH